jgi:hypothetical protein
MRRLLLAAGLALALGAAPLAAQTRVSVVLGFAVPRPFVTRVYTPSRSFYRPSPLRIFVRRGYAIRRYHRHHRQHFDYEHDDE